jgi:cytochrome c oxidase subunit 3
MTVTDDTTEDHGHHLPAVEDWPQGFGEASWWPFITALGAAGFYVGAALYIMGNGGRSLVSPTLGPAVFAGSTFVFLAGLYGWTYHAFVKGFWERGANHKAESKLRWGMVAFLGSEIATFGAGFVYYFFVRVTPYPAGMELDVFGPLVLANTVILIISSITLHVAHLGLLQDNHQRFRRWLGATLLLGIVFIGGQFVEYYEFIVHEGFTLASGEGLEKAFSSAFYGLTGLHGLHVSLGAVLLAIVFFRALQGQYSAERHVSVSTVSMYWHFVDAVWIFLVVVLYLAQPGI